jgi:FtsP/CotA-like multicopper oxidase with cupredoxin domain
MLNRRELIAKAGLSGGALVLPSSLSLLTRPTRSAHAPLFPPPFSLPLRIPPVARPTHQDVTTDYYRLTVADTEATIFPGIRTKVLTYNGEFPGATIKARRGRRVVITQVNRCAQPAVLHTHGLHNPPNEDGYPMDLVGPGQQRDYHYRNDQLGATLWYHDHVHHLDAERIYRGLAGYYLLEDPAERAFGLPEGEFEVPLMLRDAEFDHAGQLVFRMGGFRTRKTLLINGGPQPYFQVAARKYRFRFLNTANERRFVLRLANNAPMLLVGSDGGLLPKPVPAHTFEIWPGERVEAVIDFAKFRPGTRIELVNDHGEDAGTRRVMRFDVTRPALDHSHVPATLRPLPEFGTPSAHREVRFQLDRKTGMFLIDGKIFDPHRVDQHIKLGATEIWTIRNDDVKPAIPHNMHIHLVQFKVLDRNGTQVGGCETGLKDTVTVPSGGYVRLKARFADYTGRYVYHCHLLDHEAMGMMAQFEISR